VSSLKTSVMMVIIMIIMKIGPCASLYFVYEKSHSFLTIPLNLEGNKIKNSNVFLIDVRPAQGVVHICVVPLIL
jgi:hypothetical protein